MTSSTRFAVSTDGQSGLDAARAEAATALPLHVLILVAALAAAVLGQGAYYTTGQRVVAVTLALATIAALRAQPWTRRDAALAPLAGCAALAGWAVLSATFAGNTVSARATVAMLVGVAAVLVICRRSTPAQRDALAGAVVAIGVLAAATGWVGVAWHHPPWALPDQGLWRAATTFSYANAAAGLLVPLVLLALAQRVARPRSQPLALGGCLLLVGLGATLSRGGAVALTIGIAVLAWLLGPVRLVRAVGPCALGATVALLGLAPSMPAGGPPQTILAVSALLAGLLVTGWSAVIGKRAVTAVVLGIAVIGAVLIPRVLDGAPPAILHLRVSVTSPDRVQAARAALRLAERRPLTGAGPGQAALYWVGPDGRTLTIQYVHNEYLQVLAELGTIGLALLLILLAVVARMVWRGRDLVGMPATWAGVAAGLSALAVHSGLDFLWHLPAIPLTGAVLVGLTTPPLQERGKSAQQSLASRKENQ
jgi:O-antigen ligase/polysaccharide polymerase Wzy-like membrane protein